MRYRLPKGCVGVAGAGIEQKGDGAEPDIVVAGAAAADDLAAHGIVPVVDEAPADAPSPSPPKRGSRR